jgi:hypothetical protein
MQLTTYELKPLEMNLGIEERSFLLPRNPKGSIWVNGVQDHGHADIYLKFDVSLGDVTSVRLYFDYPHLMKMRT